MRARVRVERNRLPVVAMRFPTACGQRMTDQLTQVQQDIRANIVAAGRVRTGEMLRSTTVRQTGAYTGVVGPTAKSARGFPYPKVQERGSKRGVKGAFFIRDAARKARIDWPARFNNLEGDIT